MKRKITIAIDGPSGSGKSTISHSLAERLGYRYIDTGAMYRGVALRSKEMGISPDDGAGMEEACRSVSFSFHGRKVYMNGTDVSDAIRTPEMDMRSSTVSKMPSVRFALIALQREMAKGGGVVMEGRDIGTVVLPDADIKIFLTADEKERARRRYLERSGKGEDAKLDEITLDMKRRDQNDSHRELSPLVAAEDARVIDTTSLSIEKIVAIIVNEVENLVK